MKIFPKLHKGFLIEKIMLFVVLGNDDIHWLFAEWAKAVDLIFLHGFCVAGTMNKMAASVDRTQLVSWMKSCPIVVVRL